MRHSSGGRPTGYITISTHSVRRLLFLALLGGALEAFGILPSARPPLRDFDQRPAIPAADRSAAGSPGRELKGRLPGIRVDQDALGRPAFVRAQAGFLTGPDGAGGKVSAAVAGAAADPHRGLKAFLQENRPLFGHGPEALADARVTREFVTPHNGMRSAVWQQQVDGVPVFEAVLTAHTTRRGELINIGSRFLPDPKGAAAAGTPNRAALLAAPPVPPGRAVANAAAALGLSLPETAVTARAGAGPAAERRQNFTAPGLSGDTQGSLVWLPVDGTSLRLCWDVILTSRERGEMFRVLIDAETGKPWLRRCLTVYDTPATYNVYTSDSPAPFSPGLQTVGTFQPDPVSRTLVTLASLSTNASPAGWIADGNNTTLGNNVDAHLDRDDNDAPDPGSRPTGSPFRVFDCAMDLAQAPSTYGPAAVAQLFYVNNWMHDKLYELGFTEAAGNFQTDNFGRGGAGNDAVQADAQDGSGTDNANFSTPPDGAAPRMQMFVFTGPTPDRDGDFDTEIVLHEYTHGLSNRRVGGGVGISTLQAGGMGEGWSDFYPLCLLGEEGDDPRACYACGAYATYLYLPSFTQNYYFGIRRYPYSTDLTKNPLTFKDIDPAQAASHATVPQSPLGGGYADEVHNMGEVWCVTLWEARANLIDKHGWQAGNTLMLQLVTDGMALSPANPNFLQARDAIIQADEVSTGGENFLELWTAFAKRGMGFSATSPDSTTTEGLEEAYDLPDDLLLSPAKGWSATGYEGGPFSPIASTYTLQNIGDASLNWQATSSAGWLSISATGGALAPEGTATVESSLNAAAAQLAPGSYSATILFRNTTSGRAQQVTISLTVKEIPGVIAVTDSILPAQDGQLPFGVVDAGYTRIEQVRVTNLDLTYDLVISGIGFGVYDEDFNDGLAQGWTPSLASYWHVTNGEYRAQSTSLDRRMQTTYTGERWSDCTVRVKLRRTGSGDNAGVLAVRASDNFNWTTGKGSAYLIGTASYGYYYVGKFVDGLFTMIQSWSYSPYLDLSDNVIEVRLQGNQITVLFNGSEACSGTDDSLPGPGRVAVMGYSGSYTKTVYFFDDVHVNLVTESPSPVSAEQQWYNDHPSPGGSPWAIPEERAAPAYPGGGSRPGSAGFTSVKNGPFHVVNAPDLPCRLKPGEGFVFDLAFQPADAGTQLNTLVIRSNDAETPEVRIELSGERGASALSVSPTNGLILRGRTGGPFPAARGTYSLVNTGLTELAWEATGAPAWLTVDPSEGLLQPGETRCATLSVNQAAADLPEGVYSDTLVFGNASVWSPQPRNVVLTIGKNPRIGFAPAAFGVTNIPDSRSLRTLTVGNTGDAPLLWSLRLPNDNLLNDAESGPGDWTTAGVNNRWVISTNRSASGSSAWYCGNPTNRLYVNNMNAYLISPPLTLGAGAALSFAHWHANETNYDAGYVEISTNNGSTYATLETFAGHSTVWTTKKVDLSAYSGKAARIRFRFKSNALNVFEGWYVDNIDIQPLGVSSGNIVTASAVLGTVPAGGSTNVVLTFNSDGMLIGQTRTGTLSMLSNDPDSPGADLPFSMRIVKPLAVSVPAVANEGAGLLPEAGWVGLPDPLAADLPVTLSSSDPEKVSVPSMIILPAGSTQAVFDVTIGDDRKIDGRRAVTITAFAEGFGSGTLFVDDNESTNLTLALPAGGYEGAVWTNGGRIAIGGEWPSPLTVALTGSDTTEITVPATVTIPAGETSALFTVSLPLDGLMDGVQTAQVSAAAGGLAPSAASVVAQDRDLHHFEIGAVATPQSAGTPFPFTVTAINANGETIGVYGETASLSATGKTGALVVQPAAMLFVNGVWTGPVQINKPDKNVKLAVQAGLVSGQSALFEVKMGPLDHFAWAAIPSPQNLNYAFPVTVTAQDAGNNTVTGYTGTATLAGFAGENGDGSPVRLAASNTAKFAGGVWKGKMTVRENAENMRLKAADKSGHSGLSGSFRVGPLSLALKLPAAVYENNGVLANAGTVTLSRVLSTNAVITLRSANTAELKVPARITVPAGKASVAFNLTVVNDGAADGPQAAAVTAALQGYVSATGTVEVRPEAVQTPVAAPAGGKFEGSRLVALSCATPSAQIRYSENGAEVTESSPLYGGSALTITNTCTLKVRAFKPTATPSATAEALFERVPVTAVPNGSALTALSAGPLESRYYRIDVPEFCTNLLVAISGGTGECDLLLRRGGFPDTASYDYYPALSGNNESVSIRNPPEGLWYALLLAGPDGFSGVRLDVAYQVDIPNVADPVITPAGGIKYNSVLVAMDCATAGAVIRYTLDGSTPTPASPAYSAPIKIGLTPLKTVTALASRAGQPDSDAVSAAYSVVKKMTAGAALTVSGKQTEYAYYAIQAPAGSKQLTVTLTGGTGDANVYVRKGLLPTLLIFDRGSVQAGNNELAVIAKPAATWYYILVYGKGNYTGASLKATLP